MPSVNPNILRWARESAGLTVEHAAERLSLRDTQKISAAEKLVALESGQVEPDRRVLTKMSKAYRRPLISFYLREPPAPDTTGLDFRTLPQRSTTDEPLVNALVRDVKARQALLRSALEEEDAPRLPFVGSMGPSASAADVLERIVTASGITVGKFRAARSSEQAFAYLRSAFEDMGIFVLLVGNLGTHHTNIAVSAFRGICIADPVAPFIVINDQDAKPAWSFTLLHEACHLWLGETAISAPNSDFASERLCNDVASAFLLHPDEVSQLAQLADLDDDRLLERVAEFAEDRNVSSSLVIYRLHRSGALAPARWESLAERLRVEWRRAQDRQREARKAKVEPGGPSYYLVKGHRLGKALLRAVDRGVEQGTLTPTKAAKVLGTAPRSVYPLLNTAKGSAAT